MFRLQSVIFAAALMVSASAFAADTPDPNSKGDAALPSGSNAANPPAPNSTDASKDDSNANATATSPGEENKGKPPIKTE
jgi:hypothetical protein